MLAASFEALAKLGELGSALGLGHELSRQPMQLEV